jgi:hypothetical protein
MGRVVCVWLTPIHHDETRATRAGGAAAIRSDRAVQALVSITEPEA